MDFCRRKGIALYDAAYMVKRLRGNASDNFLKIIEPTDIRSLLSRMPLCRTVVSTGGKSAEQIASILDVPVPPVGGYVQFAIPAESRCALEEYSSPGSPERPYREILPHALVLPCISAAVGEKSRRLLHSPYFPDCTCFRTAIDSI